MHHCHCVNIFGKSKCLKVFKKRSGFAKRTNAKAQNYPMRYRLLPVDEDLSKVQRAKIRLKTFGPKSSFTCTYMYNRFLKGLFNPMEQTVGLGRA
jgi:hypothetical protein